MPVNAERLFAVIQHHSAEAFAWGKSDCAILVFDALDCRSVPNPLHHMRGYSSERGAAAKLKGKDWRNVRDMIEATFANVVPASMAQRGDIAIVEEGGAVAGGVVWGAEVIVKGKSGITRRPLEAASLIVRPEG
jgi:hypothetical protein